MTDYHNSMDLAKNTFQKKEARKFFSGIGFSYVAFLCTTFIAQILLGLGIRVGIIPMPSYHPDFAIILSMCIMYLIGFPVFWLVIRRVPVTEKIQRQKWNFGKLAVCFLICLGVIYIGNIIGQVLMWLVSLLTGKTMVNAVEEILNEISPITVFLSVVIVAPVTEELMFRKMLIDRTIKYGQGISVVVSGILFGIAHGNFYQFFYACGLGMIFAYIYVKTGNIKYTIVFHMLINFMGSMLPLYLIKLMQDHMIIGTMFMMAYGLLIIAFMVTSIVLLICYRKRITFDTGMICIPKKYRMSTVFLNLGMIIYFVIGVITFLIGA